MIQFHDQSGANNHNVRLTNHLFKRLKQRGMSLEDLSIILTYGKIDRCKYGRFRYFFGKKEAALAIKQGVNKKALSRLSTGATVIAEHDPKEVVIATVYWSTKREQGKYARTKKEVYKSFHRKLNRN